MDQKDLFDRAYKEIGQIFKPSSSLVDFYLNGVKKYIECPIGSKIKVLEIGSGLGSLFQDEFLVEEENNYLSITGIDFSLKAIAEAEKRWDFLLRKNKSINKKIDIKFLMKNILDDLNLNESCNLVMDSHCFHCLNDLSEQKSALKNMESNLKSGGILAIETMVSHKNMSFSPPYYFDTNTSKLFKEDRWGTFVQFRTIPEALELEKMILMENLKIEYFTILPNLRVIPESNREIVREEDPQCLRIICRKT